MSLLFRNIKGGEDMAILSIIVPAYNAEKYIGIALESLINQTLQDIEIICVNDGSTDNTLNIINKYAQIDNRIRVVDKKNEGSAAARRDGIKVATAEFIGFLDSDDYYESTYCATMISAMEQGNYDLVECGYFEFYDTRQDKTTHLFSSTEIIIYDNKEFINRIFNQTIIDGKEAVVNWNKIYKRKLILENLNNYGHSLLDDYLFNLQYYCGVNRYKFLPEPLLNYRISANSLSKQYDTDFYNILKEVNSTKFKVMQSLDLEEIQYRRAADWFCNYVKRYLIYNCIVLKDRELFENIVNDSMLKDQTALVTKQNWFTKCIKRSSKYLKTGIFMFVTLVYKNMRRLKMLIRR